MYLIKNGFVDTEVKTERFGVIFQDVSEAIPQLHILQIQAELGNYCSVNEVTIAGSYHRLHVIQCDRFPKHHLVKWTNEKCCSNGYHHDCAVVVVQRNRQI